MKGFGKPGKRGKSQWKKQMPAFIEELSGALRCGLHFLLGRLDWQEVAGILWCPALPERLFVPINASLTRWPLSPILHVRQHLVSHHSNLYF